MQRNQRIIIGVILAILIIGAITIGRNTPSTPSNNQRTQSNEIMMKDLDKMEKSEDTMQKDNVMKQTSGQYISYSKDALTSNQNVIFFAASWCPTCRALDKAINSELSNIPSGLTILKADYDQETALRQTYGVTYQHTLVQVDKEGNMLKKWNGGKDIADIVNKLK